MAKTKTEAREYQRGYNRALAKCRERVSCALKIAQGYRSKAAEAIYFDAEPTCISCERWTRGGDNCIWGRCRADFRYEAGEEGMWADSRTGETEKRDIITQEHFGCVNWIGRAEHTANKGTVDG